MLVENEAGSESAEFSLLCELVNELGLEIGDIDGDVASEIERYAEVTRAYVSACQSLAFADSSCKALERKLVVKGFDRDIASDAIEIALSRGLVDENNTVESRVRIFLSKRWGKGRIVAKLREEGFGDGAIRHASAILCDVDFVELCAEYLRRKYPIIPSERREREKIYASLARYGYSSGEIREAFKALADE
jgi:SOS response regulatory protein OraA/RecX